MLTMNDRSHDGSAPGPETIPQIELGITYNV